MKKFVFVALSVIGLVCVSSCRSTSKPCGLAEKSTKQMNTKQLASSLLYANSIV